MQFLMRFLGSIAFGLAMSFTIINLDKSFAQSPPTPVLPSVTSASINTGYMGIMMPSVTATIPASSTTSNAIYLKGFELAGILLPSTFTGASVSFLASVDGITFVQLKTTTSGTTLSYTVTQNTFAAIAPIDFAGVNYLKIVSASTEGSQRTLKLALRGP